jgi:hypothetical protein
MPRPTEASHSSNTEEAVVVKARGAQSGDLATRSAKYVLKCLTADPVDRKVSIRPLPDWWLILFERTEAVGDKEHDLMTFIYSTSPDDVSEPEAAKRDPKLMCALSGIKPLKHCLCWPPEAESEGGPEQPLPGGANVGLVEHVTPSEPRTDCLCLSEANCPSVWVHYPGHNPKFGGAEKCLTQRGHNDLPARFIVQVEKATDDINNRCRNRLGVRHRPQDR